MAAETLALFCLEGQRERISNAASDRVAEIRCIQPPFKSTSVSIASAMRLMQSMNSSFHGAVESYSEAIQLASFRKTSRSLRQCGQGIVTSNVLVTAGVSSISFILSPNIHRRSHAGHRNKRTSFNHLRDGLEQRGSPQTQEPSARRLSACKLGSGHRGQTSASFNHP